jgi:flagellar basal-body rod protein FlgB
MTISFHAALGMAPQILALREKRTEVLAANLANADTPGYKAQDLSFSSVLHRTQSKHVTLERTQPMHIASTIHFAGAEVLFRNPNQISLDGNTVEIQVEQAKYAENAVQYSASLQFLSGDFSDLKMALKGG